MDIFDTWNQQKKKLHQQALPEFYINPREVWYTKMGQNIGFEQNGKKDFKRPVLVIKKVGILFFVVPLTSQEKTENPFLFKLKTIDLMSQSVRNSSLILSQVKTMDKRRFIEKIGHISETEFRVVKEKLKGLLL